jgi:hypothetical protein
MHSTLGTALAGVGLAAAWLALLAVLRVSGISGGNPETDLLLLATGGFLGGVLLFGYGAGKRTGY